MSVMQLNNVQSFTARCHIYFLINPVMFLYIVSYSPVPVSLLKDYCLVIANNPCAEGITITTVIVMLLLVPLLCEIVVQMTACKVDGPYGLFAYTRTYTLLPPHLILLKISRLCFHTVSLLHCLNI